MLSSIELNFEKALYIPGYEFKDYPRVDLSEFVKVFEEGNAIRVTCTLEVFRIMTDLVSESKGQCTYDVIIGHMLNAYNTNIVEDMDCCRTFRVMFLIDDNEICHEFLLAYCIDDNDEPYLIFDIQEYYSVNAFC